MNKQLILLVLFFSQSLLVKAQSDVWTGPAADFSKGKLQVSENQRFLQYDDGTPFFYLGETAWELFHRLTFEQAELFLENRRQKGFNVIQAVVLAELDGLNTPNAYGQKPLINNDPAQPNEAYFETVDSMIRLAEINGQFIALLPTWGDKVNLKWGVGPVVFNEKNAAVYGDFLAKRYKDFKNIIWMLGGDRECKGFEIVWNSMARAIKNIDKNHLMTFHPIGGIHVSECFENEDWIDFYMIQSGHSKKYFPNYRMVQKDYKLNPPKPCMDGEPIYETHPFGWNIKNGVSNDEDSRRAAYWSVFSGALGHTYGNHCIWQMYTKGREPVNFPLLTWKQAMDLPGSMQMLHLRNLMEVNSFESMVPANELAASELNCEPWYMPTLKSENCLMVYTPMQAKITVDLSTFGHSDFAAGWYNPRNGKMENQQEFVLKNETFKNFESPLEGVDWVLVIKKN